MAAVPLAEVVSYIDDLLSVSTYTEEASNGLMVDGSQLRWSFVAEDAHFS